MLDRQIRGKRSIRWLTFARQIHLRRIFGSRRFPDSASCVFRRLIDLNAACVRPLLRRSLHTSALRNFKFLLLLLRRLTEAVTARAQIVNGGGDHSGRRRHRDHRDSGHLGQHRYRRYRRLPSKFLVSFLSPLCRPVRPLRPSTVCLTSASCALNDDGASAAHRTGYI